MLMNLLTAVALGMAVTLVYQDVRESIPTVVRDLALEREVRDLEAQLRRKIAWNKTCRAAVKELVADVRECRLECHSVEASL